MLSQQVHAVPCIRNSHFHGVIGNNAWGRCICLTQSCNRNSYYPCQRMWNSSTDSSEYQPKKREKLPWTESKLTQTGVAFFSNVFKAMKFYTSVIIYLWKKYTFHSYLLWGYLWNSFMVLSHPDQIKPTKILKHFLSNLHKELIPRRLWDKQKTQQSNKPVFLSGGNMRNSLTRLHVVSSRLQLKLQHAVLILNLHLM